LGSLQVNAACKYTGEINLLCQLLQHFPSSFCANFLLTLQTETEVIEKLKKHFRTKKAAHKMLVKLVPFFLQEILHPFVGYACEFEVGRK